MRSLGTTPTSGAAPGSGHARPEQAAADDSAAGPVLGHSAARSPLTGSPLSDEAGHVAAGAPLSDAQHRDRTGSGSTFAEPTPFDADRFRSTWAAPSPAGRPEQVDDGLLAVDPAGGDDPADRSARADDPLTRSVHPGATAARADDPLAEAPPFRSFRPRPAAESAPDTANRADDSPAGGGEQPDGAAGQQSLATHNAALHSAGLPSLQDTLATGRRARGDEPAAPDDQPAPVPGGRRARRAAEVSDDDLELTAPSRRPGDVEQTRITVWDAATVGQYREEWYDVKAQFVDDPTAALARARELLTGAVHELSEALLAERDELDPSRQGSAPDTEGMRVALRGYREFLDRILSL